MLFLIETRYVFFSGNTVRYIHLNVIKKALSLSYEQLYTSKRRFMYMCVLYKQRICTILVIFVYMIDYGYLNLYIYIRYMDI